MRRFSGAALRARRVEAGLTVEQMADAGGVTAHLIERLEGDQIRTSRVTHARLARALECDPDDLRVDAELPDGRITDLGESTDAWVAEQVARAPRLTEERRRRIAAALFPTPPTRL